MDSADDQFILKLTEITEANLKNEQFGVPELAKEMGTSRATLHRKIKKLLNKSSSQFISEMRLTKAYEMLKQNTATVAEISYEVGFHSASYFNKCFHDFYGIPPGEVLKGNHSIAENKNDNLPRKNKYKLFTHLIIITFLIVASSFIYFFIISSNQSNKYSIVVLPFEIHTSNTEQNYTVNSIRNGIINKLDLIEGLKVKSSATSIVYAATSKTTKEIEKEFKADYTLKGNAIILNDSLTISFELIKYPDKIPIWPGDFTYNINLDNLYKVENEIAIKIATELMGEILPGEKEMIEKLPTNNKAAFNFYQHGVAQLNTGGYTRHPTNWKEAKINFEKALEKDPNFGDAWAMLARIYVSNSVWQEMKSGFLDLEIFNNKLDSAKYMLEKAKINGITDTDNFKSAQIIYERNTGNFKQADKLFREKHNTEKKDFIYYRSRFNFNFFKCDYYNAVASWLLYLNSVPQTELTEIHIFDKSAKVFMNAGFPELSIETSKQRLMQDDDSLAFKNSVVNVLISIQNYDSAQVVIQKFYKHDSTNLSFIYNQIRINSMLKDYETAFSFFQKFLTLKKEKNESIKPNLLYGKLYYINGMKDEADWHFKGLLKNAIGFSDTIAVPRVSEAYIFTDLAVVYVIKGQKEDAYKCLERVAKRETIPRSILNELQLSVFDNIRNETRFRKIVKRMEAKYTKEHDRITKYLLENGHSPS